VNFRGTPLTTDLALLLRDFVIVDGILSYAVLQRFVLESLSHGTNVAKQLIRVR